MKNTLWVLLFALVGFYSSPTQAGPSVSIAFGWPMVVSGGDWDSCSGSARLGLGYSWNVAENWKVGIAGGIKMPFNDPHFVPRIGINAGYKLTDRFALGVGLLYEFIPAYGGGEIKHFVGFGLSPTILTKSGVGFSLVTGPGMVMDSSGSPQTGTWVIQPQITLPF